MYEVQVTITVNTQSRSEAFAEVWEAVSLLPHGNDAILSVSMQEDDAREIPSRF